MRVPARLAAIGLASCLALSLGGCGGVEFQGKVFDYVGLSGDHKQGDVQMADRGPLVIPPNTNYLPAPGSEPVTANAQNWPTDPEIRRQQLALKKAEEEKQRTAVNDPNNPYAGKPTLLDKLFNRNREDQQDPAIAAVPAPDPSDTAVGPVNATATTAKSNGYKPPAEGPAVEQEDPFHKAPAPPPSTYDSVSKGTYRGS